MSLNNTTADALAVAIVAALGLTGSQATQALVHWKQVTRQFYAALKTDAVVAVASVSGVTPGGGASGPGSGTLT